MAIFQIANAGGKVRKQLSKFLDWWINELIELLPNHIRKLYQADPYRIVALIQGEDVSVFRERQGLRSSAPDLNFLYQGDWNSALAYIVKCSNRWGALLTVAIRIPREQCLFLEKELPQSALRRANEILLLDMERVAPFARADILSDWYGLADETQHVNMCKLRHVITKREALDGYIGDLDAKKISLASIEVVDGLDGVLPINLIKNLSRRNNSAVRWLSRINLIAFGLACMLAGGLVAFSIYKQEVVLSLLDDKISATQKLALATKKRRIKSDNAREQISQHRLRKISTLTVLSVWDELTRRLPDTAWIVNFRIERQQLYINGFAQSASELISVLEESKYFANVTFTSPVIADLQRRQERFQIRANLVSWEIQLRKNSIAESTKGQP